MPHLSINMEDMPIEVLKFEPINPLISKCQIKVCYVSDKPNRNKSIITKEVATDFAKTIPGCPIVGYYNEDKGDFEEHNRIIDISNGKFKVKDTTRPYGFVPTDAKVWFQWFEDDGVPHEYLCTEGYIWTGQYPESQRVIEKGNNQSMELDNNLINAYWTKDNNGKPQFFIINEAIMSKLCILGEEVEPCFEGASITKVQFSFEDNFKEKLFSLMEQMQEILNNGGGTPVINSYAVEIGCSLWDAIYEYLWQSYHESDADYTLYGIYEEGDQKFAILRNRKDLTTYRLNFSLTEDNGFQPQGELVQVAPDFKQVDSQFALEEVEAYEATFKANHKEAVTTENVVQEIEPAVDYSATQTAEESVQQEPVVEETTAHTEFSAVTEETTPVQESEEQSVVEYKLDEIPEYQELLTKYSTLEGQVEELQKTITNLTEQNKELVQFKNKIDRESKEKLINETFYMLSDDLKKDCLDNIDKYSYDDIEAKLSIICVRNKVSFDTNQPEKEAVTTFNLESVEDNFEDAPAWLKRVYEVQEEKKKND